MHAVVMNVTINDPERALTALRDEVVPRVSQAPGFVAGYWMRADGNRGMSVIVFESEDAARGASGQIEPPPTGEVTFDSVDIREVVAHA